MSNAFNQNGVVQILGIYGDSAYAHPPAPMASFDVNQVPEMFFDYLPKQNGEVVFCVEIDGVELKDCSEQGTNVEIETDPKQIARRAFPFWIPPQYRTVGNHVVTVKAGHVETYRNLLLQSCVRPVWDISQNFTLTFTGIPADNRN